MWSNNNGCGCLWIIILLIVLFCCCGSSGNSCNCVCPHHHCDRGDHYDCD